MVPQKLWSLLLTHKPVHIYPVTITVNKATWTTNLRLTLQLSTKTSRRLHNIFVALDNEYGEYWLTTLLHAPIHTSSIHISEKVLTLGLQEKSRRHIYACAKTCNQMFPHLRGSLWYHLDIDFVLLKDPENLQQWRTHYKINDLIKSIIWSNARDTSTTVSNLSILSIKPSHKWENG